MCLVYVGKQVPSTASPTPTRMRRKKRLVGANQKRKRRRRGRERSFGAEDDDDDGGGEGGEEDEKLEQDVRRKNGMILSDKHSEFSSTYGV